MKCNKLTPNFSVANIRQSVQFYESILGFRLIMAMPETQDGAEETLLDNKEYVFAMMQKDAVEIFLQRSDSFREDVPLAEQKTIGASVSFFMEMEGIEDLYRQIRSKGVATTEMKTTGYGMREFYMKDNSGYVLGFAEKAD
jgi:uncharacterized glyoxalase superfamily protein PhnB